MARTVRRGTPPRPLVRLALNTLEDRLAPALFTVGSALTPSGSNLNNNGCVVVGDLDKDGNPDAVLSNFGLGYGAFAGSKISILYGNGAGGYAKSQNLSTGGKNISYVDLGDVNGDGWLDIAVGNGTLTGNQSDGSSVSIFLNNQAGGFTQATNSPFTTPGFRNLSSVDLADVNSDGKLDLIATHFGYDNGTTVVGQGIVIYAGDGTGKFGVIATMDPTTNANLGIEFIPTNAQAADFNGDTVPDIVCTVPAVDLSGNNDPSIPGFVYLFAGTGGGAFSNSPQTYGSGGGLPVTLTIANLDGKNGLDILVANAGDANATNPEFKGSSIGILTNNGSGSFSENALSTTERGTFSAVAADFNLDGKTDIAAANFGSQNGSKNAFVSVYYGNGNGGYIPATLDGSPFDTGYGEGGAQFVAVGDFDVNGSPDLIVAHAPNSSLQTKVVQLRNATPVLAASTTTVTVAPAPSYYGNTVTITAAVNGAAGTPTGSVEFYDGAALLGTVALASGAAAKDVTLTATGSHTITAKYLGDAVYAVSTGSKSHTVNAATTSISVFTALPGTVTFGDTVTMTATVSTVLGTGTPTGSVSFYNGATLLGSQPLNGSGTAVFLTTLLPVGVDTVQAKYTATTNFAASTSGTVNVTVNAPAAVGTTTALTSSGSPTIIGTPVTFTATVTPASGAAVPTGSVTFYDGATQIGSTQVLNGAGVAQVTTSILNLGDHSIQAKYAGGTGFSASNSNTLTHTVQNVAAANSAVTVSTTTNPSTFGTSVTFTAQVTSTAGSPLGTVTFFADGTQIGQVTLAAGSGSPQFYQLPYAGLAPGTRAITATYSGTAGVNGSTSNTWNQLVNSVATTVQIAGSGSPTSFTQAVTFTATVSGSPGTPIGLVEFFDGAASLGTAAVATVVGQQKAVLIRSDLAPGAHTISAKYLGTTGFDPATSGTMTQQVDPVTTATGVQTSGSPAAYGSVVTFTATVTGTLGSPTGNVNFFADGNLIGTAPLTATTGTSAAASLPYSGLDVGPHSIKAAYAGITGYNPSTSANLNQTISPIATAATVLSSSNPAFFGNGITFTATVTSGGGTPTGGVDFFDGSTNIGSKALALVGGVPTAEITLADLAVGTHVITAKYSATGTFGASTSAGLNQTVSAATTATGFVVTPTTGVPGDNITMTATVTVTAGGGTPTGTVNFYSGAALIGSKVLDGAGVAAFSTTGLPLGANTVQAKFVGATNYAASNSATDTVTISAPPAVTTTLALSASVLLSTFGQPATFTATVAPGTAPGTVTFYDNGAVLGTGTLTGGVATVTVADRPVGNHTIQAKYAGTAGFTASDSNTVAFGVDRGATTVTLTAPAATVAFGGPFSFTATVANTFGTPTGSVAFFDNGVQVGTGPLSGGTAVYPVAFGAGAHAVTAKFLGSTNYDLSTSATYDLTVTPAATAVTVAASAKAVGFGSAVTFTATVTAPAGTPGGKVTFFDGATALGTVTIAGSPPVALFTTAALGIGPHSVTAQYLGETNFAAAASGAAGVAVTQLPTTVTVAASPSKVAEGTPVALTATLAFPGGTPVAAGGTVTFFANGKSLGTGPLSGTTATLAAVLPTGTPSITATYGGDAVYTAGTSPAVTATVTPVSQPLLTGFKEFGVGGGAGNGSVTRFFNPDGSERYSVDVFPGFTGGVRVTSADFNNDGVADLVAGTGPGRASRVNVYDGVTKAVLFTVDPFEATFTGGVYVATGDVTGDGVPDLVISPDEGGGPRVDIYAGAGFGKVISFFGIDDPNFRGGARAAVADVNGDGAGDLIVAAGFGGGPRVAGYSGPTLGSGKPKTIFPDFYAFEEGLRNGVFITAGDLDGDGKAEVIAGGGPGGGPRITAFGAAQLFNAQFVPVANFFAGNTDNRGGVRIVARNLDNDNRADLVVGDGTGAGSHVTGYVGKNLLSGSAPTPSFEFDAFPGSTNGVYVG